MTPTPRLGETQTQREFACAGASALEHLGLNLERVVFFPRSNSYVPSSEYIPFLPTAWLTMSLLLELLGQFLPI